MKTTVYLGLGTNQGDRLFNLSQAVAVLSGSISTCRLSSVYETPPWGYLQQPAFLNQAMEAETNLSPKDLLNLLKQVEQHIGRKPTFRYGPRLIDLDILFYGNIIINTPDLIIPHPNLHTRAFVLVPLAELAPDLHHPVLDKSISELLTTVDTQGIHQYPPASP